MTPLNLIPPILALLNIRIAGGRKQRAYRIYLMGVQDRMKGDVKKKDE